MKQLTPKKGDLIAAINEVSNHNVTGFCQKWGLDRRKMYRWNNNPQPWHTVLLLGIFATVDTGEDNTKKCYACGSRTMAILVDPESVVMECVNQECGYTERQER